MNNNTKLLFLISVILMMIFSSCANNVEEIWVNKDGTGKYESTVNLSDAIPFIKMAMMAEEDKDSNNGDDTTKGLGISVLQEMFSNGKVDTSFVIEKILREEAAANGKTFTKESLLQEIFQEDEMAGKQTSDKEKEIFSDFMETMIQSTINIQMDMDNNLFKLVTSHRFDDLNKVMFSSLNDLKNVEKEADSDQHLKNLQQFQQLLNSIPQYTLKNNTLRITRNAFDINSMELEDRQKFQMFELFMGRPDYKTVIHVPGKVKSVNQKNATYKGSIVTWTVPYDDMYDASKNLDLEIKFKPKKRVIY